MPTTTAHVHAASVILNLIVPSKFCRHPDRIQAKSQRSLTNCQISDIRETIVAPNARERIGAALRNAKQHAVPTPFGRQLLPSSHVWHGNAAKVRRPPYLHMSCAGAAKIGRPRRTAAMSRQADCASSIVPCQARTSGLGILLGSARQGPSGRFGPSARVGGCPAPVTSPGAEDRQEKPISDIRA